MASFEGLRQLRERMFDFRPGTVAEISRIAPVRLAAIEDGAPPSVYELEQLAAVYGLEADLLSDDPIVVPDEHGAAALASQEEFRDLGDLGRVRVIRAARAARDLVTLRKLLKIEVPALPVLPKPDPRDAPYQQGAALAHALRVRLQLKSEHIPSVRDLFSQMLPGVAVITSDLGPDGPAGLAFADATSGPTIVLNHRGKNENPSVRRFSLAHELCHLFADWNQAEPLATISGYLSDSGLEREQRANGFAARFLCPETVVHRLRFAREEDALHVLTEDYKLHFRAAALYLKNELGSEPPRSGRNPLPDAALVAAEAPAGLVDFPIPDVPLERRGPLAELAVRAWCAGLIGRDRCARYLGVTPAAEVERVADYLGIELTEAALAG